MKIATVETFAVKFEHGDFFGGKGEDASAPKPGHYLVQPGWRGIYSSRIETMIVRIETSDGLVGYGEGQSPIAPEVSATIIDRVLAPVLHGRDPRATRVLRREMYDLMNLRGHTGGFMLDAIAAVGHRREGGRPPPPCVARRALPDRGAGLCLWHPR
jgi:D-galactarolactone cycloisomerase